MTLLKNTDNFSKKEEEVLSVLWQAEEPLSATQIANIINSDWAIKSIQNTIRTLEKKGAIEIAEITKIGKTYGRLFRPTISAEDYAIMQFNKFFEKNTDLSFIISTLVKNKHNTELTKRLKKIMEDFDNEEND